MTTEEDRVFTPMPKASATTAIQVKPGFLSSIRKAYRRSCLRVFIIHLTSVVSGKGSVKNGPLTIAIRILSATIGSTRIRAAGGT